MKNILIGTPCASGLVSDKFMLSYVSMLGPCLKAGISPHLYTLSQESLLPRGRNHIAERCMSQKFDKLFFIDADTQWSPEAFLAIVNSPFPICAGLVPLKTYPIVYNFVPFKDDDIHFNNNLRTPESTRKMREAHGMSEIPVAFTGTAFLCIDSQVFYKMSETEKPYQYPNPYSGECTTHWDFFGGGPMYDTYYSEDWAFCEKARKIGYDIRVNFDVAVNHAGNHVFKGVSGLPIDMCPESFRDVLYRLQNLSPLQMEEFDRLLKEKVPEGAPVRNVVAPEANLTKAEQ